MISVPLYPCRLNRCRGFKFRGFAWLFAELTPLCSDGLREHRQGQRSADFKKLNSYLIENPESGKDL
jgi:hypothetical protein